ncbi:MAG: M48 family metallopeptidase [Gammaproteobacteria bacterium]|nr:M48 family metallopeptidase [Gammaproteobacteria bacterium]
MILARFLLTTGLLLGPAGALAQSYSGDLPQMGEPADAALSPAEERRIGRQIMTELFARNYVLEDPEITEYVATQGWKLASSSDTAPPPLSFLVIKDPRINAFALPGGYIGVNAGLLTAAQSESEMAGVLSHELAHVTQRHIARSIEGAEAANIATWAAVLAAIIAGSADPEIVLAALSIGQASTYERQVGFTRAHELEADRLGIHTMAKAGYDPDGMASFFVRLEQQSRLYGNAMPEFLRTHPVNTTRISEARTRAAALPHHAVADPVEFSLIQARARVLSAPHPSQALEYFAAHLAHDAGHVANRYGLALAHFEQGASDQALKVLQPVLDLKPLPAPIGLLAGRAQLARGETDTALRTLQKTLERYPRHAPAIFAYADALITAGKPEQARQVLISHEQTLGTRMDTYRLLAQAARDAGQNGEAQYQTANYLYARGDAPGAVAALDAGLRLKSLGEDDHAKLQARRAEIGPAVPRTPRQGQPSR